MSHWGTQRSFAFLAQSLQFKGAILVATGYLGSFRFFRTARDCKKGARIKTPKFTGVYTRPTLELDRSAHWCWPGPNIFEIWLETAW